MAKRRTGSKPASPKKASAATKPGAPRKSAAAAGKRPPGPHRTGGRRGPAAPEPRAGHRIFSVPVAAVYPHYVAKAVKKGRTRDEVDRILRWLTGYSQTTLDARLAKRADFAAFFAGAPKLNPHRLLVTGTICGIRVETIDDPLMREIRILDKLVDELAQGRPMEKILRTPPRA